MKKFLKKIVIYTIYAFIFGEIVARVLVLSSDIPQRKLNTTGVQNFIPNQNGSWTNRSHTWQINSEGWAGTLPESYDNLITIIGDSFIENLMNPSDCHQDILLKNDLENHNFIELGRSGVTLIESMEISKFALKKYNPKLQLIYLGENDFEESISTIKRKKDITQWDENEVIYGKVKAPLLKKILYNLKFPLYLYRRFPLNIFKKKTKQHLTQKKDETEKELNKFIKYQKLVKFMKNNYYTTNIVFVVKPNNPAELTKLLKNENFNVIELSMGEDKTWSFVDDHHWTCFGHKRAASQVSRYLNEKL